MKLLTNQWALISGSSRGVGQQIALGLAQHQCNIILHGRTLENTAETRHLLAEYPIQIHVVYGDLATSEGVESVIAGVKSGPGQVDILYNNAAIQNPWCEIYDIPLTDWQLTFQVNVYALIALCNAFVPGMKRRGYGRVINLTSGIKDIPQLAPYSVSKAAVDKYTRDLAADLRGANVLANYLDPGWLKTDMGGTSAPGEVESVLPGALVPALLDDFGPSGQFYAAQAYR